MMPDPSGYIRQAAALPFRRGRVCLITSRNGRRWIIPKGWIEAGQTAGESALQEAWEEAGLTGALDGEPIGSYLYEKDGKTHHVVVFIMRVTTVAQDWPEREMRQRSWVSPTGFFDRIDEAGLVELVRFTLLQHADEPAIAEAS